MNAITSIESSTFVTSSLGLRVESEEGGSTFPDVNDRIVPAGTAAVTQGAYEDIPAVPAKWGYMSGA